tara:strand:+ start:1287 stop:3083 length:1797 start_codon:yes stop_codon:yes gene_type:complete
MATLDELKDALTNASAAGDNDAARIFADAIVKLKSADTAPPKQEAPAYQSPIRNLEFAARGLYDSAAETVGAVPDLMSSGLRAVGVDTPEPGYYAGKLKTARDAVGRAFTPTNLELGPNEPQTTTEKMSYGGGRGVADAASVMLPAAAVAKGAKVGTLSQGLGQEMMRQPVMQIGAGTVGGAVTEATDNPYVGTVAALATPFAATGLRRAVNPIANNLNREQRRLASLAERHGITLTPGQKSGSKPLLATESSLTQLPFSAGPQSNIYAGQRTAFNRAVMRTTGLDVDNASPEVLNDGFRALGRQFDDLAARTEVRVDSQFHNDVAAAANEYGRRLPTDQARVFDSYMDDVKLMLDAVAPSTAGLPKSNASDLIDGGTYKKIASDLRRAARGQKSNPDLQQALNQLGNALDGTMMRSGSPKMAAAWKSVRQRYRNMLTVDKAMTGGTQASRTAGDISFSGLKTAVKQMDPRGYARGRGDLNDLSRVGEFLGASIPPDSGTPIRSTMMRLLGASGASGGGIAGQVAMGVSPEMAALNMAASLATAPAAQRAINSGIGRRYLTQARPAAEMPNRRMVAQLLAARDKNLMLAQPDDEYNKY